MRAFSYFSNVDDNGAGNFAFRVKEDYSDGKPAEYRDCQVAKYQLGNFVLELLQPGCQYYWRIGSDHLSISLTPS
jgi:hypothetical protein